HSKRYFRDLAAAPFSLIRLRIPVSLQAAARQRVAEHRLHSVDNAVRCVWALRYYSAALNSEALKATPAATSPLPKNHGRGSGSCSAAAVLGRTSILSSQALRWSNPSVETFAQKC